MNDPISRAMRYLRREYPSRTSLGVWSGVSGALFGALMCALVSGPLLVAIGSAAAFSLFVGAIAIADSGPEPGRPNSNSVIINGTKLVGAKRDIASIAMTQNLITKYCDQIQHLEKLPPRTMAKINAHLHDIQHRLTRVRAYSEVSGSPVTQFFLTRQFVDARGEQTSQVIAYSGLPTSQPPSPATTLPAIEAYSSLGATPSPRMDFIGAANTAPGSPSDAIMPESLVRCASRKPSSCASGSKP